MSKMKAAFIGFMPQGLDLEGYFGVLENYHKLGYSAVEHGGMLLTGDVEENFKRVRDMGMEVLTLGMGNKYDEEKIRQAIMNCKRAGVNKVATYITETANFRFGGRATWPTYDEVMREVEELNKIAKELAKEGIVFTFHNHDAEFQTYYQGKPAFYHIVDNSEYLKVQVDVGWVLYGHNDPVEVLDRVGDKLYSIHVKDWKLGNAVSPLRPGETPDPQKHFNAMPRFTAPGTGLLPLEPVLKKASEMGIDYAIVEMDFMNQMCMADELRCGYLNMRETGYVE